MEAKVGDVRFSKRLIDDAGGQIEATHKSVFAHGRYSAYGKGSGIPTQAAWKSRGWIASRNGVKAYGRTLEEAIASLDAIEHTPKQPAS